MALGGYLIDFHGFGIPPNAKAKSTFAKKVVNISLFCLKVGGIPNVGFQGIGIPPNAKAKSTFAKKVCEYFLFCLRIGGDTK